MKSYIQILRKHYFLTLPVFLFAMSGCNSNGKNGNGNNYANNVEIYTTTSDKSQTMNPTSVLLSEIEVKTDKTENIVSLDPTVKYQEMDGFGAAMTGSSCYNLLQMKPDERTALLKETFDPVDGYGYSYIRVSIGCSDFSLDDYTYCDTPGIENFEIHEYDKRDLFPILKEILAINPDVKILASPWTCPKWMKVNNLQDLQPYDSWTSGQLNPAYYEDYATYFVKYIREMNKAGFDIEAITIQNEPLNRGNSASLYMTWQEQRDFIKYALGPAFAEEGIITKIFVFDHNYDYDINKPENADQQQYPLKIYADPDARKYVAGAAYHAYGGNKEEMLNVYKDASDKSLYFTEISIGMWGDGYEFGDDLMWNMREVCIGTINNYCKAIMVWNYMLDDKHGPDRPGGCSICLGAIDISSSDYSTLTRHSHYYEMAHLSKVIKPGARRIKSSGNLPEGFYYCAFENPDNSYAVLFQNDTEEDLDITYQVDNKAFTHRVEAKSVSSYRWKG